MFINYYLLLLNQLKNNILLTMNWVIKFFFWILVSTTILYFPMIILYLIFRNEILFIIYATLNNYIMPNFSMQFLYNIFFF